MNDDINRYGILVTIRNTVNPQQVFCEQIVSILDPISDVIQISDSDRIYNYINSAIHSIESDVNQLFHRVLASIPSYIRDIEIEYRFFVPDSDFKMLVEKHHFSVNRNCYPRSIKFSSRQICYLMSAYFNLAKQEWQRAQENKIGSKKAQEKPPLDIVILDEEIEALMDQIKLFPEEELQDEPAKQSDPNQIAVAGEDHSKFAKNQPAEVHSAENPSISSAPSKKPVKEPVSDAVSSSDFVQTERVEVELFVRKEVLEIAEIQAQEEIQYETGGVLLGRVKRTASTLQVMITGLIKGKYMEHHQASLVLTSETWSYFWNVIDHDEIYADEDNWKMVGWYHTHPSYGVFLSSMDMFIQNHFFSQPYHIALVIDPVRDTFGFFTWGGDRDQVVEASNQEIHFLGEDEIKAILTNESIPVPQSVIPGKKRLLETQIDREGNPPVR